MTAEKWKFFKGSRENWFDHEMYNWMDPSTFKEYPSLHIYCKESYIRKILAPYINLMVIRVEYHEAGTYQEEGKPLLVNVPSFYLVRMKEILSGKHVANVKLFLPVFWNQRFMGIAGAGSNLETDWDKEQTTNITSWPMAVRNGFACVVNDGATGMFVDGSWGFKEDGSLEWDMINNWAFLGTHIITRAAKQIVRAVYDTDIYKSYMHGTSGGARQIMAEAQEYPEDYDGLWADGPLFDYYNMMFSCLWAALVFFNEPHKVALEKYKAAKELTRKMAGALTGPFDVNKREWIYFLSLLPGYKTSAGPITKEDLEVMITVWNGPMLSDGTRITYGFGPEITQWPVGPRNFGYLRIKENGEPSLIPFAVQMMRWIRRDPEWDFRSCTYEEFERMYVEHKDEFMKYSCYDPDLRKLKVYNTKLIITHGTGDHIVPYQLSTEYYKKALHYFSSEDEMKQYFRLFLPQYGGHALYDWDGPNVTNRSGLTNLMNWAEKEIAPTRLDTMNYDFLKDKMTKRSHVDVYLSQR